MMKNKEKRIAKLEESIKKFIEDIQSKHKTSIEMGKKALLLGSKNQIDFWVVQFKLTDEYEFQAKEMLGQLDIARYSNEMRNTAGQFFICMNKMAKQLSKVFGYTSMDQLEKTFEKGQITYSQVKEQSNDLICETADRFNEIQEALKDSNDNISISDEEREKIISQFNKKPIIDINSKEIFKNLI